MRVPYHRILSWVSEFLRMKVQGQACLGVFVRASTIVSVGIVNGKSSLVRLWKAGIRVRVRKGFDNVSDLNFIHIVSSSLHCMMYEVSICVLVPVDMYNCVFVHVF